MSEYQYYEFLALDRPLSEREMGELRSISSRAEITATHFSNEYNYGDLKADPAKLLERYFDVHVYLANWGTRRFAMRLPSEALALDEVAPYCVADGASARRAGENTIIDLWSTTEDCAGWEEGAGWAASLAAVRSELLRGDARPLYLAWLVCLEGGEVDDDDEEPPVPPGLASLPVSLQTLAEFLRIDEHLIAAAAEGSQAEEPEPAGLAASGLRRSRRTRRTPCCSESCRASMARSRQRSGAGSEPRRARARATPSSPGARLASSRLAPTSSGRRTLASRHARPGRHAGGARRLRPPLGRNSSTRSPLASPRRGRTWSGWRHRRSRGRTTRPSRCSWICANSQGGMAMSASSTDD